MHKRWIWISLLLTSLFLSLVGHAVAAPGAQETVYVVRRGDTLYSIARRYGVDLWDIVRANGITNPSLIYVGQRLVIPGVGPAPTPTSSPATPEPPPAQTVYVVQRGDTLYRIALRYGVSMWDIVRANGITNPNRIYVGQRLVIPTGGPPAPTSTPTPAPQGPTLVYFHANVTEADPGDTITLEWQSTGAVDGTLYHLMATGQFGRYWDVAPCGSMAYTIPPETRNSERFALYVTDGAGNTVHDDLTVMLRCPNTWFFSPAPDECPQDPPLTGAGAEQHFERGVMLWVGAEDRIYVLFDDASYPKYTAREDHWDEGDPVDDPSIQPPAGLYQPIRGFGLLWRTEPTIRERLGWALAPEVGYQTAVQRTSRPKYNEIYIRAHDGGVWHLGPEGSEWAHIP